MVVGVIVGAWGLQGQVKVEVYTDHPDRFLPGNLVYLDGEATGILMVRDHKAGYVVGLNSVTDRRSAEALRGHALTVPSSELPILPEGTFFYFDVIGMNVVQTDGFALGKIKEILSTGGSDVYVIEGAPKDLLVPAVPEFIVDVDTERGVMTVSLPEGYLDEI